MALDILSCIKSFVTVMETGSFIAAARETDTLAPIVTKQIQKLEAHLGKKLLLRTTRRLELTEEGIVYLNYAKNILLQLQEAKEAVDQTDTEPNGMITMSGLGLSIMLINQDLQEFLTLYPKISLCVKYDNNPFQVLHNEVDIAISNKLVQEASLIRESMGSYDRGLFASPQYLAKYGTPKIIADLSQHNCLHHLRYSNVNEWQFLDGQRITLYTNYSADMMVCLVDAASKNMGIINAPYMSIERQVEQGSLVEIELESKPTPYVYYVYYKPALPYSKVRMLIQFLNKKNAVR